MKERIKKEWNEYLVLMRNVPALVLVFFVAAIMAANLLANKSIDTGLSWLALDCGILVSWASFMAMDVMIKRFGPKASTEISLTATAVSLVLCFIFFVGSQITGTWGESYVDNGADIINNALNNTFGGVWYVVLGSTLASISGSLVNIFTNWGIGKLRSHDKDSFKTFALRSYVSTAIGQFVDNFVFAMVVSLNFFGWSFVQCLTCSATGAVVELLCEIFFSPIGFKIVKSWDRQNVGKGYLDYVAANK